MKEMAGRAAGFAMMLGALGFASALKAENPNDYKPKFGGHIEAWYKQDNGELSRSSGAVNNTFRIRRARLTAGGNITDDLTYRLQGSYEGTTAALIDAYIEQKLKPWLRVGGGQYKTLLCLEATESFFAMPFVLRSDVIEKHVGTLGRTGGAYRDIGVYAKVAFPDRMGFNFTGGAVNGNGLRAVDINDTKDLWGKIELNPLQGVLLGVSGFKGRNENKGEAMVKNENLYAAHMEYRPAHFSGLRLRSEFLRAQYGNTKSTATPSTSVEPYGYYVAVVYRVPAVKPSSEPNSGWEYAYRWERYNVNRRATSPAWVTNHTLGATHRYHNDNRLRFNYIFRSADSGVTASTDIQENGVTSGKIGGLFLAQYIVGF